jgi:hypothetical protein
MPAGDQGIERREVARGKRAGACRADPCPEHPRADRERLPVQLRDVQGPLIG